MTGGSEAKRGRPAKNHADHAAEAAHVLDVAVQLHQVRSASLVARNQRAQQLGFANEGEALRYVLKRRRGAVLDILGDDVAALLGGAENRTQAAIRLHLEHGLSLELAAQVLGKEGTPMDVRNLRRETQRLKRERGQVTTYPGTISDSN